MSHLAHQKGFSIIEVAVIVVVIGIIGLLGYTFYANSLVDQPITATASESTQPSTASDVAATPEVNSTADLDTAQSVMDATDLDASNSDDLNQFDSQVANF